MSGSHGRSQALAVLRSGLGESAEFQPGQWEAIRSVLIAGSRQLLVQRTGWGKSVVYFVATRLLRDAARGPTLIVSPLLALMRNQVEMSRRFGVVAASIDSTNRDDWPTLTHAVRAGQIDALLVSPERLGNAEFRSDLLGFLESKCGLLVIDEAHCISDWGHDFRPDYRRIIQTVSRLDKATSLLCTTATANERVIADIRAQLGEGLEVVRGPLMRESLKLSVIKMRDQAERLAWLAKMIPRFRGTGIIYALTINDARRTAQWLRLNGVDAHAYHSELRDGREDLERRFEKNGVKCVVATTALGMGYDKGDVEFVIHFQAPGSIINYYQQVGRAGRALSAAYGVLLVGEEDEEINDYFIRSAFPDKACFDEVLGALRQSPASMEVLISRTNQPRWRMEKALKLLEVEGAVSKASNGEIRLLMPTWQYDRLRSEQITEQRRKELRQMYEYIETRRCRMRFLAEALDDVSANDCGRCDNCNLRTMPVPAREKVLEAIHFLKRDHQVIAPKKFFPPGVKGVGREAIPHQEQLSQGAALSVYNDAGWGRLVREAKYSRQAFPDELIPPAVELIRMLPIQPEWLCWVPSLKRGNLVPDFAKRLAEALGIGAIDAVVKVRETGEQKEMQNSTRQYKNVSGAFKVVNILEGPCLLLDDVYDSGWTMTVIGIQLRRAGCSAVVPFALAVARPRQ
ncbi:MAG: ATP-dependent DNA helicase RecG [Armatimonadota bacterium]